MNTTSCKAGLLQSPNRAKALDLPVLVTAPDTPYRRRLVRLAFLAPEIQRAIVDGRQSAGLTLAQLLKGPIPLAWSQQAVQIGIATPPE